MIRPPEESSLLKSGAPRTPKLIYDEELFLKEIEENSEDLDEAMVQMRKAAEQLGLEGRGGESQWPQVWLPLLLLKHVDFGCLRPVDIDARQF